MIRDRRAAFALFSFVSFLCAGLARADDSTVPTLDFAGVEEIEVTASAVDADAAREQSDEQIDTLSADQLSSFSIPDVAAGLRFVPGVNVVDGQFAVIRGLEDRYNSTLFNGAPVPSPDPDSQSVQLDLFPADVVSNLVVAKTFSPDLPSNSSGGSVNILTNDLSGEDLELKLSVGSGFNQAARDRFIDFESGSPIGEEADPSDTLESDLGASLRGGGALFGRELHYKGVFSREVDFETREGFQEKREPEKVQRLGGRIVDPGGLSLGALDLSGGRFDLTESDRSELATGFFGLGFGLDRDSNHTLDASVFYTRKVEEAVLARDDGYIPGFDYGVLAEAQANGDETSRSAFDDFSTDTAWIARSIRSSPGEPVGRGPLWSTNFADSKSFERKRDLMLAQLNGDHWIGAVEGLHVGWAANHARTTQDDEALGARYFFEPDDPSRIPAAFPSTLAELGPGQFAANNGLFQSTADVEETQTFGRLDADWEAELSSSVILQLSTGVYYERAKRDVGASFLENTSVGGSTQYALLDDTALALGKSLFGRLDQVGSDPAGLRLSDNDAEREIRAWNFGAKATLWEQLDVLGGYRFENISIESRNSPFTGELALDGTPGIFPNKWLLFDRLDNPARAEVSAPPRAGTTFNDQLVGVEVPLDPVSGLVDLTDRASIDSLINGKIDERRSLPSLAFTWRPSETLIGLTLRGAFSQTVARPSFREMGYYVSVEPGTDDLIVGNPQLGLSDVESWDTRAEYAWNEVDLVALSLFRKSIDDPIESIVVRDPTNFEGSSSALYRTFFNNPDQALLSGVELEARENLGFFGPELLSYFVLGGNFTYIDAEVDRIDAEITRASGFFGTADGAQRFSKLESSRRLFGQPEWIANLHLTFDQPDWGTSVALAFFAISDVLKSAGSATLAPDGSVTSFTPDRYVDSYNQLDLTLSQAWRGFTFKLSVKNLTDTTRRIVYDPDQVSGTIPERSFTVGRDYSFSISRTF